MTRDVSSWLPGLIGPDTIQVAGESIAIRRPSINFVGATEEDDPDNEATNISFATTAASAFLQNPTSANLAAALSDETGSGAAVFGTSPTVTTAALVSPTLSGSPVISATTLQYTGDARSIQQDIQITSVVTTDATATTLWTYTTTSGRTYYLTGFIEGTTSSLASRFLYRVEQYFDNQLGTVNARISSPTGGITELHETSGSLTIAAEASGTSIRVRITTGLAATTIRWRGRLFLHEGLP